MNSLAWVKHVFIPLTCEFYALHGLSLLVETVDRIKAKLNPDLQISGVICNQFNARRGLTKDVIADLENHFPGKVMKSRIRVNVRLAEAPSHGMSVHHYAPTSNGSKDYMALAREMLEVLPAAANPEVEAALAAIQAAEKVAKGLVSADPTPAVVLPTWSAPAVTEETAPVAEAPAPAVVEAPASVEVAASDPAPVVEAPAPAVQEPVAEVVAPAEAPAVDPLADIMVEAAPVAEAPVETVAVAAPVEAAAPVAVAAPVEAAAPVDVAAPVEAAASVEIEMPPPAEMGRMHEPTSPMIVSAAELAAMAPPADAQAEQPAPAAAAPVQEAPAAEEPVAASVDDNATRLGFDPYAESNAHLEKVVEAEQAKPEFVSPLPATPVAELRAAISSNAPTTPAPESTVKPVPALPSVKAAAMPFQQRIAMAGLKPIVTSKPGAGAPPAAEKKGLFSKFWKK